jgi:hypothetical protein
VQFLSRRSEQHTHAHLLQRASKHCPPPQLAATRQPASVPAAPPPQPGPCLPLLPASYPPTAATPNAPQPSAAQIPVRPSLLCL